MSDTKQKVHVLFIQDRSGSMSGQWGEVLSGYKTFVEGLKNGEAEAVDYSFSLTTFDTLIDLPIKGKSIQEVSGEELKNYPPRGCTALYDAVGKTIAGVNETADKFICVIVTDGYENASREWTKESLHAAIDAKIKLGNWTFTYLGTQPETWNDATSIGVGVGATVTYNPARSHDTYRYMGQVVNSFASSACGQSMNLMCDDRFTDNKAADAIGMKTAANSHVTMQSNQKYDKNQQKRWQ